MATTAVGGGNRLVFYTATDGTTPTVGTTPVMVLTNIISTDVPTDDTGITSINLEQIESSPEFDTFIRTYTNKAAGAGSEEVVYEDGITVPAGGGSATKLVAISRGPLASNGQRRAWAMMCTLQNSSGSYNQSANTYIRGSVAAVAAPISGDLALGTAYFSGILVTPAAATLDATLDKYGKAIWG